MTIIPTFEGSTVSLELKSATPNATIHYTLDNTEPTAGSLRYVSKFELQNSDTNVIVHAKSFHEGNPDGSSLSFTLLPAPNVSFIQDNQTMAIELETTVPGGVIYYTLNNSTPTQASPKYGGPVRIRPKQTLRAFVFKDDFRSVEAILPVKPR
jgi:hypothetical protein